jgi:hypothetical protein
MPTYEFISSTILGSNTATVSITSIPQTYNHLMLIGRTRSAKTSENFDIMRFAFNSNSSTYSYVNLQGTGAPTGQVSQVQTGVSQANITRLDSVGTTGNARYSFFEIFIPNYTTSENKFATTTGVATMYDGFNYNVRVASSAMRWGNTAAITSIQLSMQDGNTTTNSTFLLYGLKNS